MKPFYVLLFALTPPPCFAQHVRFSYDNNGNRIHREWVAERIGEDNSPKSLQLQFSSEPSDENAFNVVVDNRRNCLDVQTFSAALISGMSLNEPSHLQNESKLRNKLSNQ